MLFLFPMRTWARWIVEPPFLCALVGAAGCVYAWDQIQLWFRARTRSAEIADENAPRTDVGDYFAQQRLKMGEELRVWPSRTTPVLATPPLKAGLRLRRHSKPLVAEKAA